MPWLAPLCNFVRRSSSSVVLRPYQESCLQACLEALQRGTTRIGVSLPTGSGKTTIFISLLSRITGRQPHAKDALIIVNSIELAQQSADQARRLFPDWTVEIEQGVKHKASGRADITVATYQTLLQPDRLAKFDPGRFKAIIIDEAHHAAAPSYRRLLSYFEPEIKAPDQEESESYPLAESAGLPIIGFSATFSRHDGLALGSVFQEIVYHQDFLDMARDQWLCDVRFTSVKASIDLSNVTINSRTGDFNPTSLAHVINTGTINKLVVQTWIDRAATRKSTLVFCVNIAHVETLTQTFRSYGIDARYISSKTAAAERKDLVAMFKTGRFPVLINCGILTEGADIPNIDCILLARPTRSSNLFTQMIGRGVRQSPMTGKADCRIIDFVDSSSRVEVISTPTLFGLDPSETVDDENFELLAARSEGSVTRQMAHNVPLPKSVTYLDYENPFAFVHGLSGAPHIAKLSPNAWVGCGEDVYVLECLGKGFIRINSDAGNKETNEPCFIANYTPAIDKETAAILKTSPFLRSRRILSARSLADAVRGCDTYALTKVVRGPMVVGLRRSAKWRQTPASDAQKTFLEKRLQGKGEEITSLTKGEAANMITRLKHGALMRYEKKTKQMQKAKKDEYRRSAKIVKVGPLQ